MKSVPRPPIEVGLDSFATAFRKECTDFAGDASAALRDLVTRIAHAEAVGLDHFGIGEHHRRDFLDSAPPVILVGGPNEIAQKILEHSAALGGISRLSFQMDVAALPQAKLVQAITLLGERVAPLVRAAA